MKISHNWLQTYFDQAIPSPVEMEQLFPLSSFEIEGLSTFASDEAVLDKGGIQDTVIDTKILPDRAHYALSHKGIAEEVSFLTKLEIKNRFDSEIKPTIDTKPTIKIENPIFCRRYTARIVELGNEINTETVDRLKKFLNPIGQRTISPIVDATNYVMYDIGQPLHAFDADKIVGSITIRPAIDGEKITLLDGREITLTSLDNVIADDAGALVIAGAKGGKRAEISEITKRIMIESANFSPTAIRRTSTKYDIRSDSSKRFENEITPELALPAMYNISAIIDEMIPGSKFGPIVDEYPTKAIQTVIEFDPAYLEQRLGIEIPANGAIEILERMGVKVQEISSATLNGTADATETGYVTSQGTASGRARPAPRSQSPSLLPKVPSKLHSQSLWSLTIPFERLDLIISEDIVEEIGRIYGYDHIKGILPPTPEKMPSILPMYYLTETLRDTLVNAGFSEVSLYTLVEKGDFETAKPLARDKAYARKNLFDGMMACVEKNALNADLLDLQAIKIFEIGHVFSIAQGEKLHLAIGVSEIKKIKGFKTENLIQDTIKLISESIGITTKNKPQIKGNFAVLEIDLDEALQTLNLADSTISYENLNLGRSSDNRYEKFSQYPFIVRDIAVFVPESISSDDVWESIKQGITNTGATGLLNRHSLFDTFNKDGKISYAFRMIFQSMDRTLTDDEVNAIMEKINTEMSRNVWEVR